jgi:RNA polymerase sigma-70 factor (ECF subfamily)
MESNGMIPPDFEAIANAGTERWPGFNVRVDDLADYSKRAPLADGAFEHAADVVLACACVKNVEDAVAELHRVIRENVPMFVRRIDRNPEFADEICQRLHEKLLLGDPPRLATYTGSGPLLHWLRVMAVHLAIDTKRAEPPLMNVFAETFADTMAADVGGPELDVLKARYGPSLLEAVSRGLRALPRRQRAVLRLYVLAHLSSEEIGRMYRVHRATVARWISSAERSVFDTVKAEFRERWGLATSDVASLARLIRSQLPMSLEETL